MAMLKRFRDEDREFDINNCLMLLSKVGKSSEDKTLIGKVFACKTCNKEFSSFQALGGHRASHKKPKLTAADFYGNQDHAQLGSSTVKAKTHECTICGVEFAMWQALGGHMRRHRAAMVEQNLESAASPQQVVQVPLIKKSSSKKILCLDLNLTPFENDLDLGLGKIMTPVI